MSTENQPYSKNFFDSLKEFRERHPLITMAFFIVAGLLMLAPYCGGKTVLLIGGILSIVVSIIVTIVKSEAGKNNRW